MGTGDTAVCSRGAMTGLALARGSPNDDDREGGGTEGYVSSSARGCVPTVESLESDEAGVVIFVPLLVDPTGGEKGNGENSDADVDDGGVVDELSVIEFVGQCT